MHPFGPLTTNDFVASHSRGNFLQLTLLLGVLSVACVVAFVFALAVIYFDMPIKYLYPDDSCAIVVEADGVGHDCGWEEGKKYRVVYVGWNADLSTLHGDGLMPGR